MPFTVAHTAVSLPFIKRMRAISVFGLILGSMAPDFEYFLRLKPASMGGHTVAGMFFLNLPICIVIAVLYMNLLEDGLIQLLPDFIAQKWPRFGRSVKTYAIAEWLNFVFWTLVGMLTHIGWDAFTHSSGYFVGDFSVLTSNLEVGQLSLPLYKVLQHGSSILGLLSIAVYIAFRSKRARMPQPCRNLIVLRIAFFGIIALLAGLRFLIFGQPPVSAYGEWIVSLMSFALISWLIVSIIIKRHEHQAIREFLAS